MAPASTLLQVLQGSEHAPALTIASGGPTLSRKTLLQLCIDFANSIKAAGLRPGDVVTIADLNTVGCEYPVCVHINPATSTHQNITSIRWSLWWRSLVPPSPVVLQPPSIQHTNQTSLSFTCKMQAASSLLCPQRATLQLKRLLVCCACLC